METLYLITGATGHLGLNLVKKLLKNGNKIRALCMKKDFNIKYLPKEVEIVYGDVMDKESLNNFFENDSKKEVIVVHCAGIVSIASKYNQRVHDVNVDGTKNIVNLSLKNKVKKFLYVSSVHAIKELPNKQEIAEIDKFDKEEVVGLYAKTKSEATEYVLQSLKKGLNAVVVHPSGIIGPNDYGKGHITQLIIDLCNGKLTAAVNGGYDFVDVRDVVDGMLLAIEKGKNGECYILSNKYFEVKTILDKVSKIANKKKIKLYLKLGFVKAVAPLAELYYRILKEPPLFTKYSIYTLQSNSNFSHKKANKELGYTTRSMDETLIDTILFLKQINRIKE